MFLVKGTLESSPQHSTISVNILDFRANDGILKLFLRVFKNSGMLEIRIVILNFYDLLLFVVA